MNTEIGIPNAYILGAIAYAALVLNAIVLPFLFKGEHIFKDLINSGAKDLAISNIESEKLIPALTELTTIVIEEKDQHGDSIDYKDIFQNLDFQPYIERVRSSMNEIQDIGKGIEYLQLCASRLWKMGLTHMSCALITPAILYLAAHKYIGETVKISLLAFVLSIAVITVIIIVIFLNKFAKQRNNTHNILGTNRG